MLVEIDARTGFTDHLVHAGGKVTRPPDLKRNLLYVIIAEATNMGLGAMAERILAVCCVIRHRRPDLAFGYIR